MDADTAALYADLIEIGIGKIEPRGNWTQGAFALNQDGEAVPVSDDDACKWCADGAVRRAAIERLVPAGQRRYWWERCGFDWYGQGLGKFLDDFVETDTKRKYVTLADLNDGRRKKDVIALLRRAVEKLRRIERGEEA